MKFETLSAVHAWNDWQARGEAQGQLQASVMTAPSSREIMNADRARRFAAIGGGRSGTATSFLALHEGESSASLPAVGAPPAYGSGPAAVSPTGGLPRPVAAYRSPLAAGGLPRAGGGAGTGPFHSRTSTSANLTSAAGSADSLSSLNLALSSSSTADRMTPLGARRIRRSERVRLEREKEEQEKRRRELDRSMEIEMHSRTDSGFANI